MKINLILLSKGNDLPAWVSGDSWLVDPRPASIAICLDENLPHSQADAWLFWDAALPLPSPAMIRDLLDKPDDLWHAGLLLGQTGQPGLIDFAAPTWRLNRDPDPHIEAMSWRLSLRACLIRSEVLHQLGGPLPQFESLDGAALEMGYRCARYGVMMIHTPTLLSGKNYQSGQVEIPLADQLRFIKAGFDRNQVSWVCLRAVLSQKENLGNMIRAILRVRHFAVPAVPAPYIKVIKNAVDLELNPSVSVIIPTLDRYSYLRTLLGQVRTQTVLPCEVIIIDQTAMADRVASLQNEFADLHIRWLTQDETGLCTACNLGLRQASGKFALFLDDDNEISTNLIDAHLRRLNDPRIQVSNGLSYEIGLERISKKPQVPRMSDYFSTNNTMLDLQVLSKSGLFDLAYDRGKRADGDLGMRIYLSGARMLVNPEIIVRHHRALRGGLRQYGERRNTFADSHRRINLRVLPSVLDIYYARRYFSPAQVREMLWRGVLDTFNFRGAPWKKVLKAVLSFLALPSTIIQIKKRTRQAAKMLKEYPRIPFR
jgi:glycosyltransferase involved in cell wall biosynthesis